MQNLAIAANPTEKNQKVGTLEQIQNLAIAKLGICYPSVNPSSKFKTQQVLAIATLQQLLSLPYGGYPPK